jgi:hyperosmotically inducible periplasmic protein
VIAGFGSGTPDLRIIPMGASLRRMWEPWPKHRYYDSATHIKTMKLSVPLLVSVLTLTGSAMLLQSGCASTQTRQSTGEYVDDAAITTKVKAAFVKDPTVKAMDVSVDTFKGTVQLSGFVNTAEEKARAEQVARTVNGVVNVQNNISVK